MDQAVQLERFQPFFNPSSVVIIGASRKEYTFNGVVIKNLLDVQYPGIINIIHPFTERLMGIPCLHSIEELAFITPKPDLAIILTQNDILLTVENLGKQNITHILIETDISVNLTALEQSEILNNLRKLCDEYKLQILGPSMIGIIDFQHKFTSSVIPTRSHIIQPNEPNRPSSGVSFLAQSGGLTGACGWWSPEQNIPFAKIVHIGQAINVTEAEILEFLILDDHTKVIILYLKTIPEDFVSVLQRNFKKKPILYKYVGRETELEKKFQQYGAISVENYIELFDFAKTFLWCPPPKTDSVGIIGPSSGAINLLIAEMRKQKIHLANLDSKNRERILQKVGGSTCALGNPVDFWPPKEFVGTQICQVYYNASTSLLEDSHVGALFLALEFFTEIEFDFSIFDKIKKKFPYKPIIAILIQAERSGRDRIIHIGTELKIPVFENEIERGIRALKCLISYYETRN